MSFQIKYGILVNTYAKFSHALLASLPFPLYLLFLSLFLLLSSSFLCLPVSTAAASAVGPATELRDQDLSIIIDDCDSSIADGDHHPLLISLLYSTARLLVEMGNGPAPFSEIGKRTRDLLTKDYNYDQKFTLSMLGSSGMGLTATGVKKDHLFVGDMITQYKSGNTTVDVKVDTSSNVSTTVSMVEILPSTKVALSFKIPDQKSGKLDVQYIHPHSAINSSIGLTPTPLLELAATIGSRELMLGGEVGFDAGSGSFTKYNFGIGLFKPDFSAAVVLADKGETVKASYIHSVNSNTGVTVAAEMTHRLSTYENSFTLGSSHPIDPFTVVKTRFSDNGKVAMLCQREWRPKSLVTFSGEYDAKAINSTPKFGLALALKP